MSRPSYAWAPPTVRHLFRAAGFGACPHGVLVRRLGDIAWASACSNACREGSEPSTSTLFAVGHYREVKGKSTPFVEPWLRIFRTLQVEPIAERRVERAIPADLFDLACSLDVQSWGVAILGGAKTATVNVAVGFVLGMPICLVAPERECAHHLTIRSAA